MNGYRRRIHALLRRLLDPYIPVARILDVGSGDGWFAEMFRNDGFAREVVAIDVKKRKRCYVAPLLYDGLRLPFDDRSFDLTCSIDVLHHCTNPLSTLNDLLRCTRQYLLIKDHTYESRVGKIALTVMDESGNGLCQLPWLYNYQRRWEWLSSIQNQGFMIEELIHPAVCHKGVLGRLTNHLQFIALGRRMK